MSQLSERVRRLEVFCRSQLALNKSLVARLNALGDDLSDFNDRLALLMDDSALEAPSPYEESASALGDDEPLEPLNLSEEDYSRLFHSDEDGTSSPT